MNNTYFEMIGTKPIFAYQVIEQFGENTEEVWEEENGVIYSTPKAMYLFTTLGGSEWNRNKFLCTLYGEDAKKQLRNGELISVKLKFKVRKNDDGTYEQLIIAENVVTLNEYYSIREAIAEHEGKIKAKADSAA